ncbi:hypothetical protein [Sellimonas intestinalis]|uniref:hypothetical protein n=1 Tax=Sellimonas intestinalis TaxID=1653434 RepID=UPI00399469A6
MTRPCITWLGQVVDGYLISIITRLRENKDRMPEERMLTGTAIYRRSGGIPWLLSAAGRAWQH